MIQEIKTKNREEWLELRKSYIGGSEAGAVMGLDSYSSPYRVWAEKTGRIPGFDGNITTEVGAYLEELVAQMFCRETGKKVRRKTATMVNDLYPWACADVDRMVVGESALLECKTTTSFPVMRKVKGGEYPERWYCQMTHYMAVTGLKKAYLAVLVNCRDFRWFELERDQEEIDTLMRCEHDFWQYVASDEEPPADGLDATGETLATIYADGGGGEVELFGRTEQLKRYFDLDAQIKDLKRQQEQIKQAIQQDMGEAEKARCAGFKISWPVQDGKRSFNAKRLEADYPDMDFSNYYETGKPFRRFTIKEDN